MRPLLNAVIASEKAGRAVSKTGRRVMESGTSNSVVRMTDRREVLAWLQRAEAELRAIGHALPSTLAAAQCYRALHDTLLHPPKVALLGERNAGKSTLANALIGRAPLPTSMISSTRLPTHVFYGSSVGVELVDAEGHGHALDAPGRPSLDVASHIRVGAPVVQLHDLEVIDWPGTDETSQAVLTERLSRLQPELIVWCTPCTQAWTETERACWAQLPARFRKRALLVGTFADLVSAVERDDLRGRLRQIAGRNFGDFAFSALGPGERTGALGLHRRRDAAGADDEETLDPRPLIRSHAAAFDRNRAERALGVARWVARRSRRAL